MKSRICTSTYVYILQNIDHCDVGGWGACNMVRQGEKSNYKRKRTYSITPKKPTKTPNPLYGSPPKKKRSQKMNAPNPP